MNDIMWSRDHGPDGPEQEGDRPMTKGQIERDQIYFEIHRIQRRIKSASPFAGRTRLIRQMDKVIETMRKHA